MSDPALWLLDEPTAGLDLGGREQLVRLLGQVAADATAPATVMVTHHVDEIPPAFSHVLLLAGGRIVAMGPLEDTLTAERLSTCFGVALKLERRDGRWWAWGA
jgi:iron complex transport system ATP-binding protein